MWLKAFLWDMFCGTLLGIGGAVGLLLVAAMIAYIAHMIGSML